MVARGADEWIIVVNAVAAAVAFGTNIVYAARTAHRAGRLLHAAIAVLAAIYSVSYVVLVSTDLQVVTWSSAMRGVSLLAWLIVWIGPSVERWRTERLARVPEGLPQQLVSEVKRRLIEDGDE